MSAPNAKPSPSLVRATTGAFTSRSGRQGREYFDEGRVAIEGADEDTIVAFVRGSRERPYGVAIRFADVANRSRLEVSCSCKYFLEGFKCKHIHATLLAIDAAGIEMVNPAFLDQRLDVVPFKPDLPLEEDWFFAGEHSLRRVTGATEETVTRAPEWENKVKALRRAVGNWQEKLPEELTLERGAPEAIRYVIEAVKSEDLQTIVVAVEDRLPPSSAEDTPKGFRASALRLVDLDSVARAEDRAALQVLLPSPLEGPAAVLNQRHFVVPTLSAESTLRTLIATGALCVRTGDGAVTEPLAADSGAPWRCRLDIEPIVDEDEDEDEAVSADDADDAAEALPDEAEAAVDEAEAPVDETEAASDEAEAPVVAVVAAPAPAEAPPEAEAPAAANADPAALRVVGRVVRGDEARDHGEPVLLVRSGWMVLDGRLCQVEDAEAIGWIRYLRKAGEVATVPAELPKLLAELATIPGLPPLSLPAPWTERAAMPEPEVVFAEPKPRARSVLGQVFFHYPGGRFALGARDSAIVDEATHEVVRRDGAAERAHIGELVALGTRRADQDGLKVELEQDKLPRLVRTLVQAGWRVEASGRRMRGLSKHDVRITSNQDWFDLTGNLQFDDVEIDLPDLLRAIKQGSQFIRLGDGSEGVLPESWLSRYAALANLGHKKGKRLRFAASQTILLDMLLEGQDDILGDSGFEAARAALDKDAKVEQEIEPESFGGELRDYQRYGLGWTRFLRKLGLGGCLADDMGLGKTIQVLALLERRHRDGEAKAPTLVVAPRSLIHNWMDEASRFTPDLKALAFVGPDRHTQIPALETYDLIITTYGTLRRDVDVLTSIVFDYVVLDEAQAIKNASAQASKAARLLRADHRLALSGTPVENHLVELWSIFEFLNPKMLGSRREFAALARPDNRGALERVARGLKPMILRRTKGQVLSELPAKTELTVYCEMESEEAKQYRDLRDHLRKSLTERVEKEGMGRAKVHVLEALLRLRQAACHPGLLDSNKKRSGSAKIDMLMEHLTEVLEEGHKVLVFSQFVQLLSIVRDRLDREKIPYAYLDGSTRDREAAVRDFREDDSKGVFLISLRAGGLGLNLTEADYVYILDPWWNPAVEAQAIDRAHRIGQTRPVFAYRLITQGTVEEKIQALQAEKVELAEAVVAANEGMLSKLSLDDLRSLLS